MWECPKCETLNEEDICVVCDEAKPIEEEWSFGESDPGSGGYPPNKNGFGKAFLILIFVIAVLAIGIVVMIEVVQAEGVDDMNEEYNKAISIRSDYNENLDLNFSNQDFLTCNQYQTINAFRITHN